MKKVVITGSSGFLGWYVTQLFLKIGYQVLGTYRKNPPSTIGIKAIEHDLRQLDAFTVAFKSWKPDAVIHLAANSRLGECELDPQATQIINVAVPGHIALLCSKANIPFIFASSDMIFDGQQAPYEEITEVAPINIYGQQKRRAEQSILSYYPSATIARLPLLYGCQQPANNFLKNWIEQLKSGKTIKAFHDEYRTPASGMDVAKGLLLLLEKGLKGIWHLGGPERISRYDFALQITEVFQLPTDLIQSSSQKEVKLSAARPADVSLNSDKAFKMGYQPLGIRDGLLRELHNSE